MKLKTVLPLVCLASACLAFGCFLASDSVTPDSSPSVRGAVSADSLPEEGNDVAPEPEAPEADVPAAQRADRRGAPPDSAKVTTAPVEDADDGTDAGGTISDSTAMAVDSAAAPAGANGAEAAGADTAADRDGDSPPSLRAPNLAIDSALVPDGEARFRGMVLVPADGDVVVPQVLTVDLQLLMLQILGAVNEARRQAGAPMLGLDPALLAAARRYSAELAMRGEISHDSPRAGGRTFRQRLAAAGGRARLAGENLARVTASPESLAEIVTQAWLRSAGHRRNLLDRQFTRTGIGVSLGPDGVWYVTQMFATPY